MNTPLVSETNDLVSPKTQANTYDLSDLKALFYLYNAKPDTEIKLLKGGKVVQISDIVSLEEQVADKLGNHEIVGQTVSVSFILSNRKIKEFLTWGEFQQTKWDIVNEKVLAISICWNILIQLPRYKSPQTHSIKVRLGSSITPKDMFQLIFTSDDISELMEAQSPGICKVDFINTVIASELLFIVDNWYSGLKNTPELSFIQSLVKTFGKNVTQFIRLLFPPLLLSIFCIFTEYLYPTIGLTQSVSINNLQTIIVLLITIFMLGTFIGRLIEKSIDELIDKFQTYPSFLITKGDASIAEEFDRCNKSLTNKIFARIGWLIVCYPISYALRHLSP